MMRDINRRRCSAENSLTIFKTMPSVGKGVEEIRVTDETGAYHVIYVARRAESCVCCTRFKRRRTLLRGRTLRWRRDGMGNW
jgi:phage-related protein